LNLTGALWLSVRIAPVVTTTSIILGFNKVQNGDVLVPANPDPSENGRLNGERERERERHGDRFEQIGFFFVGWILFETTQTVKRVHLSSVMPFTFDLFAPELILTPGRIKVIMHI